MLDLKSKFLSIELERALTFLPTHSKNDFECVNPIIIQNIWEDLIGDNWKPVFDPTTGVISTVRLPYQGIAKSPCPFWTCTTDVCAGIFETTLAPATNINELKYQQTTFDKYLSEIFNKHGIFLWNVETPPKTKVTRPYYFINHTYWRGMYPYLRSRGCDHYWFSWTYGNNPSIDVTIDEAINFMRIILRLTGITFFLLRMGSISGGGETPNGLMSVRPGAWSNLWKSSPYPADMKRTGMPDKEITSWTDYFHYILDLPIIWLLDADGKPARVIHDPSFIELLERGSHQQILLKSDGYIKNVKELKTYDLKNMERQILISRLRCEYKSDFTPLSDFYNCLKDGEDNIKNWLKEHLTKLYLEIRSDGCPPKDEEFSTLALYIGLLTNMDQASKLIIEKYPYSFWQKIFNGCSSERIDTMIDGVWIPDLIMEIVEISKKGLNQRGFGEDKYLKPIIKRVNNKITPAEEILKIYREAGGGIDGLTAFAKEYGFLSV